MNSWLYPISKRSGYYFTDKKGRRVRTSYESFRDFVFTGLVADDSWGVYFNFGDVRAGDEVFVYTGERDRGIIGYAKVVAKSSPVRSRIRLRLNLAKTRLLLVSPVTASRVRPLIPPPRGALVNLRHGIRRLRQLLPWTAEYQAEARAILDPLKLKRRKLITAEVLKHTHKKALSHDSILAPVSVYLSRANFEIGTRSFGRLRTDLVGVKGRSTVIVEGKVISPAAGREAAREALGQLLEYSWWLQRDLRKPMATPRLWIAFSARPDPAVSNFLHDHNVIVSWPTQKGLSFYCEPRLKLGGQE